MRSINLTMHRKRLTTMRKLRKSGLTVMQACKKAGIVANQYYTALRIIGDYQKKKTVN